jgi:addiction module HigA family antidote
MGYEVLIAFRRNDMRMHNPPHPGKVLREFLGDVDVTTAARHLKVSRATISRILNGKAGISADMSLRLSAAFDTHAEIWYELQADSTCGRHPERNSRRLSRSFGLRRNAR